jgi:hypothetical protein
MKLVYGRPDDAFRIDYNDVMWKKVFKKEFNEEEPIYNSLEETVKAAIIRASMVKSSKKFI